MALDYIWFFCLSVFILAVPSATEEMRYGDEDCPVSDLQTCVDVCNCSSGGEEVHCDNLNLTLLPSNIPQEVIKLNLSGNRIKCVPKHQFESSKNLRVLYMNNNLLETPFLLPRKVYALELQGNQLQEVEDFFRNCDELSIAHFKYNKIKKISTRGMNICPKLYHLTFDGTLIRKIEEDSFPSFTGLRWLSLNGAPITEIAENSFLAFCNTIQSLLLPNTHLTNFPALLVKNCSQLKQLRLYNARIPSFDPDLFRPKSLSDLNLGFNPVVNMSESTFVHLKEVQILQLPGMELETLPEKLFWNTSLGYLLDLSTNKLKTLPEKLFSSANVRHLLQILGLSANKLTTLPPGTFRNLHGLKELHLDGNMIVQLPRGLLAGTNVQMLYIFQNNLTHLTESLVGESVNHNYLTSVFAQNNKIHEISTAFISSISDGGFIILSCDNVSVPEFSNNISIQCVPNDFITSFYNVSESWADSLKTRGFVCRSTASRSHMAERNCQACPIGTFGYHKTCMPCPRGGFYQDAVAQFAQKGTDNGCKPCNAGNYVDHEGGASPLDCGVCPDGTDRDRHASYRACFCVKNYFRRNRFNSCELCPHFGADCTDDVLTIKSGYYWNWSHGDILDYVNLITNLRTMNNSYDRSTTSYRGALPLIHQCPDPFKCENTNDNISGNCQEGYTGWMCSRCSDYYFSIFGFCRPCPRVWVFLVEIVVVLLVICLLLAYVVVVHRRESTVTGRSIVDVALARGKIILGFYQVMGEFWESLNVMYWQGVFHHISYLINIIQLNVSSILVKPSCFISFLDMNPYFEFVVGVMTPFVIIAFGGVSLLVYMLRAFVSSSCQHFMESSSVKNAADKILMLVLLALFVTYPSTCNVIFALYRPACDDFSIDENRVHNISLLRPDYSINCSTEIHFKFEWAAYVSSFYVIAFPCLLFCLLKKFSRPADTYPIWLRFLSENYKKRFWFWEIVELVRKVSQTLVIVLYGFDGIFSTTVTLAISVVFLVLHTSFAPMKDRFEHHLQLASLWAIFLNMLVAVAPVGEVIEPKSQTTVGIFLVVLNLIVLCIALGRPFLMLMKMILLRAYLSKLARFTRHCCFERHSQELGINLSPPDIDEPSSPSPLLGDTQDTQRSPVRYSTM